LRKANKNLSAIKKKQITDNSQKQNDENKTQSEKSQTPKN